MRVINFSAVGVPVNSLEELDDIYLTYSALDIPIAEDFKQQVINAQRHKLKGWFIQSTKGAITTQLGDIELNISLIDYPIKYSMESLEFAVACQLINSNQEDELKAHLDKYCKEYK